MIRTGRDRFVRSGPPELERDDHHGPDGSSRATRRFTRMLIATTMGTDEMGHARRRAGQEDGNGDGLAFCRHVQ